MKAIAMPRSNRLISDTYASLHEPTLGDIIRDIMAARIFIALGGVLGLFLATSFLWIAIPTYQTMLIVAPSENIHGAEVSTLLQNEDLFALRYLVDRAGVTGTDDFIRFGKIITGPAVSAVLLEDPIIRRAMQEERLTRLSQKRESWTAPDLADYLAKRISIGSVGGTNLRQITYQHADPLFANYLLSQIHIVADKQIRDGLLNRANRRIEYLNNAIAQTANPDHRKALTSLLMEQEKTRMMVTMDEFYAADVIEAPSTKTKPTWPNIPLTLIGCLMIGMLLGFVSHTARKNPQRPE